METKEVLKEIVNKIEEKYRHIIEISRLTEELEETLRHNDDEATFMVMTMRANEMDLVSDLDQKMEQMIQTLEPKVHRALKYEETTDTILPEIKRYHEIKEKIRRILEQTIKKDRRMSEKIAGNDSFYAQQK